MLLWLNNKKQIKMSYIKNNLTKGEVITKTAEFHSINWVIVVLLYLMTHFFSPEFPVISVILFFSAVYLTIRLLTTEMVVTNKRVIVKSGWIARNVDEIRFYKVETVEFNQGVFARILGYGQVKVTGTGLSKIYFKVIINPKEVKNIIDESLDL